MAPPSSAKKKNLKQGNLFSFFSKAASTKKTTPIKGTNPSVSVSATNVTPNKPNGHNTDTKFPALAASKNTQNTDENTQNTDATPVNPSSTKPVSRTKASIPSPPPPSSVQWSKNTLWRKLKIGSRVGVYWKDDKCYYPCTVEKRAPDTAKGSPSSRFFVRYDDGESEWTDMATEKLRWCDDEGDEFLEEEEEEDATSSSKRRRTIQESEDEEEEQEWEDPGDESEDDDDGSVFDAAMEDEEEDNWMVTDDEEEDYNTKSKKRPAKKKTTPPLKVTEHSASPNNGTPPPLKKFKSSAASISTTSEAFKTPLKSFSHTVSPQTLSSQKSMKKNTALNAAATPSPSQLHKSSTIRVYDKRLNPQLPLEALPCNTEKGAVNVRGAHVHNHLQFLRYPKDSKGRYRDDPEYDCRTLQINESEWKRITGSDMTAAVRQWWHLKSQYFDTILLFKTGKFYEMFHTDADVGVEVLGFIYMKGKVAHSGFPEISYGQFADKLVRAGYKVARVEQTETPDMLKVRKSKTPRNQKKPQVVNREVCSILSLGTRTFCALDDRSLLLSEANGTTQDPCGPLLVIREITLKSEDETTNEDGVLPVCEYGITVVDAIRGTLTLGMFADDVLRNRLRTLLACFDPSEILLSSDASKDLKSLLQAHQSNSRKPCRLEIVRDTESFPKSTALDPQHARDLERGSGPNRLVQPWDPQETLKELHRRRYYPRASRKANDQSVTRWPAVLKMVVEGKADLCLSSLGAALFYLQRNLIDREILSMGIVRAYIPQESTAINSDGDATTNDDFWTSQQREMSNKKEGLDATVVTQEETILDGFEENPLYKIPLSSEPQDDNPSGEVRAQIVRSERQITHMSLDGTTLHNLEILTNSVDFKVAGSLWSKLNSTKSPHGARMLRAWLLRPLFQKADIDRRADAVQELVGGAGALALREARDSVLGKVGDLDRLLSRIHSMSVGVIASNDDTDTVSNEYHPNERAVLYEGPAYTKRKVTDFKNLLKGLEKACQIPEIFANADFDPNGLLYKLVRHSKDGGLFPDMVASLDWFFQNFDCDKAANGQFVPGRGADPVYDQACDTIQRIQEDLENYKEKICQLHLKPKHVAARAWKYVNTKPDSKDKYLIELPVTVEVPQDFHVKAKRGSGQKQVNKYRTPHVADLVKELEQALEVQQARRAKGMQIIFAKFDSQRALWAAAAHATAILDALGSLAIMAGNPGYCRAEILECEAHDQPSIQIVQGRHPVVENTFHTTEFIPNDIELGPHEMSDLESARLLLLSGPNMGGKSTMLRQTCLIAILAQIGSYVPAECCRLTPIDCIFTRLGASDRILLGQSTFFVELAETAAALRGATRRSLVIMDELGRGTSTFDGTAIASATVKHLVERSQCLSLFATHYHSLLDEWKNASNVRLGHMQCIVDDENENGSNNSNITFLYTLGPGACPKSFGINVAKLAGLPDEVLTNAKRVSIEFEEEMNSKSFARPNRAEMDKATKDMIDLVESEKFDDLVRLWKSARGMVVPNP